MVLKEKFKFLESLEGLKTKNFQMYKLDLEKAKKSEIKLPTSLNHRKSREFQTNIYFRFTDYTKAFDCVDHDKLWKILKEMAMPDHLNCLLRICRQVKKHQLELDMEQQFSSVAESCPTLCDPMGCSIASLPFHHQLLKFTQIHVHPFSDAIQPSHLLSSPSPTFNLSQHQGIFK